MSILTPVPSDVAIFCAVGHSNLKDLKHSRYQIRTGVGRDAGQANGLFDICVAAERCGPGSRRVIPLVKLSNS